MPGYYVTSSGLQTADAAIAARGGFIHAVTVIPAAAASSVVLYDNATAASGLELAKVAAVANGVSVHYNFAEPICANKGIFADVSGSGAAYIVYYSLG